jgi:triosephosphate isomerase
MRNTVIAGNWKMNGTLADTKALISDLRAGLPESRADVVVCPPFTALSTAKSLLDGTRLKLGAQDVFWKERGAYTGQISPPMLVELGCRYVIVGHSEPRGRFGVPEPDFDADILSYFGDTDAAVNRKLRSALAAGLTPICCVGETLHERRAGHTDAVVTGQASIALRDVAPDQAAHLIFAYEPVWAIGTGETCRADEANRVCGVVREAISRLFGTEIADGTPILYGGSVKPENARELLAMVEIDGALVGGASLKAADFAAIVEAAPA